jgi:predicted nucleic-acid-binding Zn-ribbon protein
MKHSASCPKCQSRRQWVIERFRTPSERATGDELRVVNDQPLRDASFFRAARPMGCFDMYICADCGFSELWARDFEDLVANPAEGVVLRDNSDPRQGPFR